MTAPAIQADALGYAIGTTEILRDVSLTIATGSYVSIIGPNGAGKTTLLKCMNRLLNATRGHIDVQGRSLETYTQRELAKVMSYVPQADPRYFPYSVYEFVMMGRYPHLSPFSSVGAKDRRKVDAVLELTGMTPFADRSIQTLSGGERQSVFIAAALAQGAQILLLDEPTTFLDYRHRVEVLTLLQRLNKDQGITVIAVTHDVNSAVLTSDTVIALKEGTVAFDGPPGDLMQGRVLEDVYDTGFDFVPNAETGVPIVVPKGEAP